MCGIAGFFQAPFLEKGNLTKMADAIAHRGPDAEGFYFDKNSQTGLGHRRLSIIDLSPLGKQPMTYQDSGLWIVFNGEVFNYLELKKELIQLGFTFHTETDTEVLLVAYIAWGADAFKKLNGMFAFGIYNERDRSLILVRDRYGIKPLYYWQEGEAVVFASELKAFAAIGDKLKLQFDKAAIQTALHSSFELEASGFTLFKQVKNLAPGHYIQLHGKYAKLTQWWNTVEHLVQVPKNLQDQAAQFRELFADSCRLRLRSDVPIGTSLSGGLDSSSVVMMLSRLGQPVTTFIHTFKGTNLDESDYANLVAEAAKVKKVYVEADQSLIIDQLDKVIYQFESIYPGLPDSPYRIYQAQSNQGIKVTLDGHGSDEMLAGYDWYLNDARKDSSLFSPRFYQLLQQQKNMMGGFLPRHFYLKAFLEKMGLRQHLARLKPKAMGLNFYQDSYAGEAYKVENMQLPDHWGHLQRKLYHDFHRSILPRILKNFDLMSMAHGVEVRMPFMDYRLVNFVFSLPDSSKLGQGYSKLVLRESMKGILPEQIRTRQSKMGFNSPLQHWLRHEMREWVENTLQSHNPLEEMISLPAMKTFYHQQILTGKADWSEVGLFWSYLSAVRLLGLFQVKGCVYA
ncbi:MAG: asparagine synthase [Gammaproteobacteria bacterium]|jgi:asparagine synthase (glutamine-hydrolysing)|nr:asparagine synthase [Gammaproteobacteria bacterium]